MNKQITGNRLQTDTDLNNVQPRAFTRRLVELQEAERRALARDLHDTAGQAMTVLSLGLAMLRREEGSAEGMRTRIDELRHVVDTLGEDLRRLSVNLRPSSLDRYGLAAALEQLVASVRRQIAISFNLQVHLGDERLPGEIETALYRIVQEACTNITRYADASSASIAVKLDVDAVEVTVEDDGRGFDVDEVLQGGRLGLLGMAERAEMLGGSLTVASAPGQGTRLFVRVPRSDRGLPEVDAQRAYAVVHDHNGAGPASGAPVETPGPTTDDNEAAELARAKVLSDVLVEIMAAAASSATADDILGVVLARTAAAIACDTVHIDVREGAGWVTRLDDRGVEAGHRYEDEQVPALVEVERTQAVLVINDTTGEVPDERLRLSEYGVKSYACVPLVAHGTLQGVIAFINFSAPEPFSPSEIDFFNRLAGLLSLALENVHLREIEAQQRADLKERVEELEALLDVLPVGIGIAYDRECRDIKVNPAFARMLGISREANASLTADEAERPRNFKVLKDGRELAPEQLPMQLAAAQGQEVRDVVVEVERDDGNKLTLLEYAAPLYDAENQPRGSVGAFIDVTEQVAAARAFSHQELARLSEELQQTNAELEAILTAVADGLVVNNVAGQVTRISAAAQEMLGYSDEERKLPITSRIPSKLWFLRPDATAYPVEEYPPIRALRGEIARGEEMIMRTPGSAGDTRVLASAGPIRATDGTLLGAVTTLTDISALHEARTRLQEANTRLTAQAGELREAARQLDQRVQERTAELAEREASLREAVAEKERALQELQAAMQELQASRSQLHHLANRLVEVQEQERSYVADHLYNQAGQMLAALKIQLKLLEKQGDGSPSLASVTEMQTVLDRTLRDLHELAAQLHPIGLDHPTGVGLLRDYVIRFSRLHGLSAQVFGEEVDELQLAPQTITAVYRSLEEALSNVVRHARATEISLTIASLGDFVCISLWDNGIGFDPASTHQSPGVGLISIRERMQSVGGKVTVESGPGGTSLVILAPLKGCNHHGEDPD